MRPPERAELIFGVYLVILGLSLLAVPETFVDLMQMPEGDPAYVRIVGALAGVIGFYYVTAARDGNRAFIRRSVVARVIAGSALVAIGTGAGEPTIALFSLPDYASALWTWMALKGDARGD